MITYVNTVFVSNNETGTLLTKANIAAITSATVAANKGRFTVFDVDANAYDITADTERFKIGMITGKMSKDHNGVAHADIKWSNIINVSDIKKVSSFTVPTTSGYNADTEDVVTIDFNGINSSIANLFAQGGKRVIIRLTFKDLPTRFRKWTESYEYMTSIGDDVTDVVAGLAELINKQWKRARVVATTAVSANAEVGDTDHTALVLTAMPYDDDNSADTINVANKVRFNANVYYTDPAADGWEALNKHFPKGVTINKQPGFQCATCGKLVRDREAQAMGYLGILNRGEGTWPIVKPAMETNIETNYNAITLEFENTYRAADDIFRKTKQTVEIYMVAAVSTLVTKISTAMGSTQYNKKKDSQSEDGVVDA